MTIVKLQNSKRLHEIMVTVPRDRLMHRPSPSPDPAGVVMNVVSLSFVTVMIIISGHAFGLNTAPDMTQDENKRLLYQKAFMEASTQKSMCYERLSYIFMLHQFRSLFVQALSKLFYLCKAVKNLLQVIGSSLTKSKESWRRAGKRLVSNTQ
jgi:hypothetical protein